MRALWRKLALHFQSFSSSSTSSSSNEIPVLYSFLQPSIFPLRSKTPTSYPSSPNPKTLTTPIPPKTLTLESKSSLQSSLHSSLLSHRTDDAWRSFKTLTSSPYLPSPHLSNSLILHLSSLNDRLNLKRAFASAIFLIERNPESLSFDTLKALFRSFNSCNAPAPAFALIKILLKNRIFPPFEIWGRELIQVSRRNGGFGAFLKVFEENCRVCLDEKVDGMRPDSDSCNEILDGCWLRDYGISFRIAAKSDGGYVEFAGCAPDSNSFGSLAYLYAWRKQESRTLELDRLMDALGYKDKMVFSKNLISGFVKSCNFEEVINVIIRGIDELANEDGCSCLGEETYVEIVKGFIENGRMKDLASLIIKTQELELAKAVGVDSSVGFRIISACVSLGFLDKAHSILDEMNAQGASVGLNVYSPILKAYCKEQRTAEAAQLVSEISASGLKLDSGSYDSLIDASMSAQDFQSAFSLFREMREARVPELKTSYLTIMAGLTESHRPELMASFLDSVVDDPRVEIATHDWNSIIHAFAKVGRIEDARRTYRRMVFLRFEPNNQTFLSLINGYVALEKYFSVLILWNEVRRKMIEFDHNLLDAFLYALVKGGFFDAAMQVVGKAQELKMFIDKWRHKQAFMETHKKLKVAKLRRRNFRKMESVIAFKNWAGLNV
ncbi:pentatricopeptide repeat-containing protein At1g69290-like [Asparagus officinalis]|uniref:pentatricopeptide repeat-containing protein At1g69290-like n=1 Tax=Asparagus officinalis TaxID=4686 RepID=UPI00098DF01C|nr:pentatricopeptide repeat-containing protein At1g69290-like [Asparagus officinalis]